MPSRVRVNTVAMLAALLLVGWTSANASSDQPPAKDLLGVFDTHAPANVKESPGRTERVSTRPAPAPDFNIDPLMDGEVEPNDDFASATALNVDPTSGGALIQGNIFGAGDEDFYSFTAQAGDRVFAATQTAGSANGSTDSVLQLLGTDGMTVLEADDDNGTFGALSSSIAGVAIPANGTYFLRVSHSSAAGQLRPYRLYLRVASGAPTAEMEPNDFPPGQPLPNGYVTGSTSSNFDIDTYALTLNAGDTVFISVDLDPERDNVQWNGQAGLGRFGANLFLVGNDDGSEAGADSEAFFITVQDPGNYVALINTPFGDATFGTYIAAVTVFPKPVAPLCTTFTNATAQAINSAGVTSSTINVPGSFRIADVDVTVQLNHTNMPDLDVHLRSPAGNNNGLFTDVGSSAQTIMDLTFDDEAALPIGPFVVMQDRFVQPEQNYRLHWFDGEDAGGDWTLDIRDDTAGNDGTLTSWSLTICEAPPPVDMCPMGQVPVTAYSSDFEADDGGFTSAGAANEWERGTPNFAPIDSCNGGSNCWATDLDNTYDPDSNQELLSPSINLTNVLPPIRVTWSQRYQMESASFDHYAVDVQEPGGTNPTRLFEWLDGTMQDSAGPAPTIIEESAGWATRTALIDSYSGAPAQLRFAVDSDGSVQLGGVAIDDVMVTGCQIPEADLSITKDDGAASSVPGTPITYTIVAANAGPADSPAATVTDNFPAALGNCSWTCVASAGASCAARGTGNISDPVVLPAGSNVTYTVTCDIDPGATGTLDNTASIAGPTPPDPDPSNNSATDSNVLTPQVDLAVSKDDGVTNAVPGTSVTYSIVASNLSGPSNAPGSQVVDNFPAACTSVNWTCAGSGGGSCTAMGSGNINDTVDLPVGASVTYTAICAINPSATGTLDNTVTVSAAAGITDTDPANNSATDSDTLVPTGDLQITKTDNADTVQVGATGVYVITATNPGPSDAPGVMISDSFPANFTAGTWTCVGAGGGSCTANGSGDINEVVNLPAGASVTFSVNGTYAGTIGIVTNTATLTPPAGWADPDPSNNSATDTTQIVSPATLSATKVAAGNFIPGGGLAYTIEITNSGPQNQLDNPGPEMIDVLPFGFVYLSSTASSGTLSYDDPTSTLTWSGPVAVGQTVVITIVGSIDPAVAGQTITNQAEIRYDADGDGTNEATTLSDDTTVGGNTDPTVVMVGNIVQVPVNNLSALLLLLLALGGTGLWAMRRNQ